MISVRMGLIFYICEGNGVETHGCASLPGTNSDKNEYLSN